MMLAALLAFIGVFVYAVQIEKEHNAIIDTRLPAEASFGKAVVEGSGTESSLAIQHMGSREISMKLTEIIAEALTFNQSDYATVVSNMRKYFTPDGYNQYTQFLTNSAFQNALTTQGLQSGAFAETDPVELGRGAYSGVYKWVFEVPVTVSLIPRNAETYRNDETVAQNRNFVLRAQLARVNDPQDPDAVKIELWQVLPARGRK